ncbi:heterokaryon incompatibility protein-domain-containing protein [Stachybotrys elegans]|uniref:Heterokaryon incompatibility protein-domain-containing protein n=1 Tax=Stachybotrys elegans TaxID=80388 RepID=A0A8K0SQQ3_9HYPO|nr:heterokaryon incompatibility protein-domain-containing protein [Stachybotrys elegans]
MSCAACASIALKEPRTQPPGWSLTDHDYYEPHHPDISRLCISALSGCRICIDLWRFFFKQKTPEEYAANPTFITGASFVHAYIGSGITYRFLHQSYVSTDKRRELPNTIALEFVLNSPLSKGAESKRYILRNMNSSDDEDLAFQFQTRLQMTSAGRMMIAAPSQSELKLKRWNLVQSWISNCVSSHPACKARQRSGFFPTRLVHVPFGPMPAQARYRLVETASLPVNFHRSRYLTLSHRWGEDQTPKYVTSSANIQERLTTDAIDAAAQLQISFIWIDSLCIIQSQDGDWATEIQKMADVYSNSFLNISATSASNPETGLTSSFEMHPRVLRTTWSPAVGDRQRVIDLAFWRERVTEADINSRGWVLQERALAPRVLHFTFDQVAWECCEKAAAEEFPRGVLRELLGASAGFKRTTNVFTSMEPNSLLVNSPSHKQEPYAIWRRLIEEYGPMELTHPADKLPAISGLARAVQRQTGDECVAGLWKKTLISDLLWSIPKTDRRIRGTTQAGMYDKRWDSSKRASVYRAPSWSWTWVDGNVESYVHLDLSGKAVSTNGGTFTSRPLALILDITTVLKNPDDDFGQVSNGVLRIYGQMHRLGIDKTSGPSPLTVMRATGEIVADCIDEPVSWSIYEEAYFLPLALHEQRFSQESSRSLEISTYLRKTSEDQLKFYKGWEMEKGGGGESKTSKTTEIERCEDDIAALDAGKYFDKAPGLLLCPTSDRTAFKRFGFYDIDSRALRRLQKRSAAKDFSLDEYAPDQKVIRPDDAATYGDVITGVFEIV